MAPDLVVTDFAGTTLRDDGVVLAAYRAALDAHRIPFTDADLAAARGAHKRGVFVALAARVYPPAKVETIATQALAIFEAALDKHYTWGTIEEIPGAAAAVRQLQARGVKVALASGFDRRLMDLLVGRLGWDALFDATIAASEVPGGRPAPYAIFQAMMRLHIHDVHRVAVIGDTPLDLQAGTNAGAGWVIGVLSGAHGIETLGATAHTHLLASIATLPALFALS